MSSTVCFTGHRTVPDKIYPQLYRALTDAIEQAIASGATHFRTGGAMGFDTMAALAVLSARQSHPNIALDLILPCPSQTRGWSEDDLHLYEQIKTQANSCRFVSTGYYKGVLQERNRALVTGADLCIAYLRNSHGGGTAYTAAFALKNGLELINLADLINIEKNVF